MNTQKQELKEKMVQILESKRGIAVSRKRVETICRAAINRLSYDLLCEDHSIFLEKEGKKVFIERNPNRIIGDGYGLPAYQSAFRSAEEVIEELKLRVFKKSSEALDEAVCDNRQAV